MDYQKIEDSVLKSAMDFFRQSAVNFFGINTKIIAPAETELKDIKISTNIMDYTFYTEDGNYLHFEFQTTNKEEDIRRFLFYDASLYYKSNRKIKTIVVYSADIENAKTYIDAGNIKYSIDAFYMNNINGDEKYDILKDKIENNEELTDEEILSLTFIPLMKGKLTRTERTLKSIELADKIESGEKKIKCLTILYAFLEKFGDEESKKRFKEVFNMTEIGKMILEDGMAKGIEKGMEKGRAEGKLELLLKQLTKKFKKIPEEYRKKIKELSDETLEIIGLEIFDMKDIKELEKYF
ncbi:hypothetical protein Ccar_03700 [Clostridium carboxidivorans P7]|uniref:DUF4351 domain-containing protein n=1 Tax=Clostridium carboxidivorans P7 TaxID=536227 RepID=C6PYT4_9CLOT|nr:DUF4351 domain-containing protein [Clostridium carboxidivorans]AKN29983.1 hypothetical protein Ccar_03700 [Clostridium carboxidivorans P7]EET85615.1 conserved hypothetical protein [Clostridium carboxidivorans P7]